LGGQRKNEEKEKEKETRKRRERKRETERDKERQIETEEADKRQRRRTDERDPAPRCKTFAGGPGLGKERFDDEQKKTQRLKDEIAFAGMERRNGGSKIVGQCA
jgi:hypothetical protein